MAKDGAMRVLESVCAPRELNLRLLGLEQVMGDQLNVLKTMLLSIETQIRSQETSLRRQHRALQRNLMTRLANCKIEANYIGRQETNHPSRNIDNNINVEANVLNADVEEIEANVNNDIKERGMNSDGSFDYEGSGRINISSEDFYNILGEEEDQSKVSIRDEEIEAFNSSIHVENDRKMFTYYWRVPDIRYRMTSWSQRMSLRSPNFYVFKLGYKMFMRIFPNRGGRSVYIHAALTKGEHDAGLSWPFTLPLRIAVLDHSPRRDDIVGRLWDPTQLCSGLHWQRPVARDNPVCVGLGFPKQDLDLPGFIHNGGIVVKLSVLLH